MKHRRSNRTLGRKAHHRDGLLRNLTSSLLEHGSITTTAGKAKELRGYFEPLVTKARGEMTLHTRRRLLSELLHKEDLPKLIEVARSHAKRPGGYIRLTKLPLKRSDGASEMRVDIVESSKKAT